MTSDRYIYFFSLAVPSAYLPCPSIHGILEAAVDRTRYTVPHTGHFRQWIHTRAVFSLPVITRFRLHAGAATDKYSRWRPGHEGAFASRETSGWSPPPPPPAASTILTDNDRPRYVTMEFLQSKKLSRRRLPGEPR